MSSIKDSNKINYLLSSRQGRVSLPACVGLEKLMDYIYPFFLIKKIEEGVDYAK